MPRTYGSGTRFLLSASLLSLLGGCHMESRFVTPDNGTLWQLAITSTTPPLVMTRDNALYMIETDIPLTVRMPSDAEAATLGNMTAPMPFASMPWVQRGDYEIEMDVTVMNLTTDRVTTSVTINGINEFNRYTPGFTIDEQDVVPDFSQWERTYSLRPGERRTVTIREEELDEVATDLAAVVNGMDCQAIANEIVYFQNQAGHDARSRACIPAVIPGLVGLVMGLRVSGGAGEPPPAIAIEATIRMRDVRDRVPRVGEMLWTPPDPAPFTPPQAMM